MFGPWWGDPNPESEQRKTLPIPAYVPKPPPKLPRLVVCGKCGCTYLGECPTHTPEEGGYAP